MLTRVPEESRLVSVPFHDLRKGLGHGRVRGAHSPGPCFFAHEAVMDLKCMICGEEAVDGYEYTPRNSSIVDPGGPHWVYCRKCDCWTEHPDHEAEAEKILLTRPPAHGRLIPCDSADRSATDAARPG